MSGKEKAQYVFKMKVKGTALKGLFNFKKAVLTKGTMRWCLSETKITCSEVDPKQRILVNYTIDGKNLPEYKYSFPEEQHSMVFEIREFVSSIAQMKISDTLKIFMVNRDPSIMYMNIINSKGMVTRKKLQTQIQQEIIAHVSPDIYSKMPVNLEPNDYHSFIREISSTAKKNGNIVTVSIQAPGYISFSNGGEPQSFGTLNKKREKYKGNFRLNELKHILKLTSCTLILGIYEPISNVEIAPLCIRGNMKNIGSIEVYVHRDDVEPIKENEI